MKKVFSLIMISAALSGILYFLWIKVDYPVEDYFPINENNQYSYNYRVDDIETTVTMDVDGVRQTAGAKQFSFSWKGKYNDRIQTFALSPKGLFLVKNQHLRGEFPMKSTRILSPPLLMIPARLKRNILISSFQAIYDDRGNFRYDEKIEGDVSFLGPEDIDVPAGRFKCLHFCIRHNYRDGSGNSTQMHTYNIWISRNAGIVKFIHTFAPFVHMEYIKPEEKHLMNRYNTSIYEVYELREAMVNGIKVRNNAQ